MRTTLKIIVGAVIAVLPASQRSAIFRRSSAVSPQKMSGEALSTNEATDEDAFVAPPLSAPASN